VVLFVLLSRFVFVLLIYGRRQKRRWTQSLSSPTAKIQQFSWSNSFQTDFPRYISLAGPTSLS